MTTDTAGQVFAGISNENEFYGHHYLSEVFKGDIRDRLTAWQQREEAAKESAKMTHIGGYHPGIAAAEVEADS